MDYHRSQWISRFFFFQTWMMVMTAETVNRDRLVSKHCGGWSGCWPECLKHLSLDRTDISIVPSASVDDQFWKLDFSWTLQLLSSNLRIRAKSEVKSEVAPSNSPHTSLIVITDTLAPCILWNFDNIDMHFHKEGCQSLIINFQLHMNGWKSKYMGIVVKCDVANHR